MGEAFTRHSLRPLDSIEGHVASYSSGVVRRETAKPCPLLFETWIGKETLSVIPGRERSERARNPYSRIDVVGARSTSECAPHAGLWLWIPGSRSARPGKTMR